MPFYELYPTRSDGVATGFEAEEFCDDNDAIVGADRVLEEHDSAEKVEVWESRRHVGTSVRWPPKT